MNEVVVRCLHSLITVHACDGNFFVLNYLFELGGVSFQKGLPKAPSSILFPGSC